VAKRKKPKVYEVYCPDIAAIFGDAVWLAVRKSQYEKARRENERTRVNGREDKMKP
jgi:hypothetical protein